MNNAPIDPRSPALNYVVVQGMRSPGRATLTGVAAPYQWDIKPSYGREGAVSVFRGRGIAKPLLTLALWLPEHFVAWAAFSALLGPPKTGKPMVVEMAHPLLSAADISAVSVESVGQPEREPGGGLWTVKIQLIEWRPPKPALVKPRGAVPSPDKNGAAAPTAKTEADLALEEHRRAFADARDAARRARWRK